MIVCQNEKIFPDIVLRLNDDRTLFTGGELIELKESKSCNIASFNSTIPTGEKAVQDLSQKIIEAMQALGENPSDVPIRQVFYLVKGVCEATLRVCLVHGRYFQTMAIPKLIREAFRQVLTGIADAQQEQSELTEIFVLRQIDFSRTRHVAGSAVSLRFRVMTQVEPDANILERVPADSLNFVVPSWDDCADDAHDHRLQVADGELYSQLQRTQHIHKIDGSRYRLYSIAL
jgi:hypothetical protein